jgi:Glu-tRNA(Gln) amidotransferase subunit E-like FAD-binding protein
MVEIKSGIEIKKKIRSGIEVHQQLDTCKLFCKCPSVLRNDSADFEVSRRLHAVVGEDGNVDVAAKHEASLDREFIYEGFDSTCLVELDEEPPHLINDEALEIGLHVAMLLNCEILPVSQIMRKTVVDGSNTSGFQRTVLIARDGYVETSGGRVGIDNISLEEDSARVIGDKNEEGKKTYRLDRLGIPLIEIGTAPDIKTAEQAKEVALHIGDILRSCKVKRGIGTIRQDVNVSIDGHPRIEIKGFQDVKMFVPTIEREVERQEDNLKKAGKSKKSNELVGEVRNALADGSSEFLRPMPGSARMYPETDLPLLVISKKIIDKAKRSLPKLRSEVASDLVRKGLREEEVSILLKSGKLEEFNGLLKILRDSRFVFKLLIEIPKDIGKRVVKSGEEIDDKLTLDVIESIINKVKNGSLDRGNVKHVMEMVVEGKTVDKALNVEKADLSEIENEIAKIVKEKPGLSVGGYMGLIMGKFKGKVSGKEVNEILDRLVK